MKKKLMACIFAVVMILTVFALPVAAADTVVQPPTYDEVVEPVQFNEMTRIYLRVYNGRLQARVWSITNGRWLTDWTDL